MITTNKTQPILSICVPTYNRAKLLGNLLQNISNALVDFYDDLEFCVSDNDSDDETAKLLADFKKRHYSSQVKIFKQKSNVGSSRNIIDLCLNSTGKWILVVGDDDGFIYEELERTIDFLKSIQGDPWILTNLVNGHNNYKMVKVHKSSGKTLSNLQSKFFLLANGSVKLGFIGVHIFPRKAVELIKISEINDYYMWPHIMLMTQYIGIGNSFLLMKANPVVQSFNGQGALFWAAQDFYKIEIQKAAMSSIASDRISKSKFFYLLNLIRQLYSAHAFSYLLSWKIRRSTQFGMEFHSFFLQYLLQLKGIFFYISALPAFLCGSLLAFLPNKLVRFLLPSFLTLKIDSLHQKENSFPSNQNGYIRKL